ncbi:MAG: sigma 54-interacting transcriptional regulator [Bdellovibrionales bacterium]|nr:sigma 54-interacting transcriptional regulator [Bdellovibrionales bacterium]
MIFKKREDEPVAADEGANQLSSEQVAKAPLLLLSGENSDDQSVQKTFEGHAGNLRVVPLSGEDLTAVSRATAVVSLFEDENRMNRLLDEVIKVRHARRDGTPTMIVAARIDNLIALGKWLHNRAEQDALEGIRLIAASDLSEVASELGDKLGPVTEQNIIKMPLSPEIPDSGYKYFYTISPSLREVVRLTRELAENNVSRIYLLGGPGAGKTSIAYYYWLSRAKGNFVTINLNAESTGDKAAMKSLLCGHVTGSFPGASAREGALSFAKDGVCFLDESHGVTGVVMQVLMEVLDSNQYYPFGATAKRLLECAVIFASNRSWESLRDQINLDEHARLGATLIEIEDLSCRPEDLVAVLSAMFAKFEKQCTTWQPPRGLTDAAWRRIQKCPWRGNLRTLMRVFETAAVHASAVKKSSELLDVDEIEYGIGLWEPEDHHSHKIYTSVQSGSAV